MKLDKKTLLGQLISMGYDLDSAKDELDTLIEWYKSLPDKMTLYRVLQVDNIKDIDKEKIGSHYSTNKTELISNHCHATGYGDKKFLVTVRADKSLFNINETLSNNILYPNENEITLKNKGRGVKIISIEEICEELNENTIRNILREEVEINSFIRRRYKSKKYEEAMKRAYDYYLITTDNKQDFVDGVIEGTTKVYFRILYNVEISDVLSSEEINKFNNYVKGIYSPMIVMWYYANRSRK